MLLNGYIRGKDVRLCMECKGGVIVADMLETKKQTVYCSICGTKHTYKRTAKGSVAVEKFKDVVCSTKKRDEILIENREYITEFVVLLGKELGLTKENMSEICDKVEKEKAENV